MVKVAVAGGTGGVGRAIVEALKQQTTHEYIVLSRKVQDPILLFIVCRRICP
jgi:nucleoside-diphosphate-sugar epimerase